MTSLHWKNIKTQKRQRRTNWMFINMKITTNLHIIWFIFNLNVILRMQTLRMQTCFLSFFNFDSSSVISTSEATLAPFLRNMVATSGSGIWGCSLRCVIPLRWSYWVKLVGFPHVISFLVGDVLDSLVSLSASVLGLLLVELFSGFLSFPPLKI